MDGAASVAGPLPGEEAPGDALEPLLGAGQLGFRYHAWGCYHDDEDAGRVPLSNEELRSLRAAVERSRSVPFLDPAGIGLTPEALAAGLPELVSALTTAHLSEEEATAAGSSVTLDAAIETAFDRISVFDGSTEHFQFVVRIPSTPALVLSTTHGSPWMLPWTVQLGTESWQTYSLEVPRTLSRLLPASSGILANLDGEEYWSRDFWSDRFAWRRLEREQAKERGARALATLTDLDELSKQFSVQRANFAPYSAEPRRLASVLAARGDAAVDVLRWSTPLLAGHLTDDANGLLGKYERIQRSVERRRWLLEWKSLGQQRSIEGLVNGADLHDESRLDRYVSPAWQHAQLPGSPTIELVLRKGDVPRARMFLSEVTGQTLIINTYGLLKHGVPDVRYLGQTDVSFHPTTPRYLLIDAVGRVSVRTIPPDFPALQRALAELDAVTSAR